MILVTGATGFVGRRVVAALREEGRPVRCLVRERARAGDLEAFGCELADGDVTNAASVQRATEGCDVVIHLVAIIQGKPADFERVMIEGTRNVVEAAQRAGVRRFILMSALGTSEETKTLVPYYGAKWAMEQAVKESGLEHVIFRPSFVFGPGGAAIEQFSAMVRYLPVTPVVGSGKQLVQPIYVDDVAQFLARAVGLPEAANGTFDLAGPDQVTWNELWARLAATLGKRRAQIHLPFGLVRLQSAALEKLPNPPVTRDQLTMLEHGDNTADEQVAAKLFGIQLVPLDEQLRRSLVRQ
jgi:NADH dehydrogenase